jgi:hypothetical protein
LQAWLGLTLTTQNERQARSREARARAGGKQLAVMLSPAATAKLAKWRARGFTDTGAINLLLERSKP